MSSLSLVPRRCQPGICAACESEPATPEPPPAIDLSAAWRRTMPTAGPRYRVLAGVHFWILFDHVTTDWEDVSTDKAGLERECQTLNALSAQRVAAFQDLPDQQLIDVIAESIGSDGAAIAEAAAELARRIDGSDAPVDAEALQVMALVEADLAHQQPHEPEPEEPERWDGFQ